MHYELEVSFQFRETCDSLQGLFLQEQEEEEELHQHQELQA